MNRLTLLLILLLSSYGLWAQSYDLTGKVSDTLYNPLPFATILAKPISQEYKMLFASTNENGIYVIELLKNVEYNITVNILGYTPYSFVHIPQGNMRKNIEIKEDVTQLDEVVVTLEIPIIIKKDTIIYRVDHFTTGEERKLKDIMEKLPGIEVDKDGIITSQGKKVTHVLVEEKSFFGGNSKLAVENIPANAVKKVEIIDDYNEISFLKGMTRMENMAVNIKLKENKKNFVFGDVEAGKGNNDFYSAHTNLFYYRPEININFIGGANNTGKNILTYQDYQRFIDGTSVFNERDMAEEKTLNDALNIEDVLKSNNTTGAFNFTKALTAKVDLSSYIIFSDIKNETFQETTNEYLLPTSTFLERTTNSWNGDKKIGLSKLRLKYKPNNREEWSITSQLKHENIKDGTVLSSSIDTVEQSFETDKTLKDINATASVEWHKKISKKHAFSSTANMVYIENDSDGLWSTNRAILDSLVPLQPVSSGFFDLALHRKNQKLGLRGIFKHYWNIDSYNLIHMTIGNSYKEHRFFSYDAQLLENGGLLGFGDNGFGNDVELYWNDFYIGLYYNYRVGEFDFHQSLFIHNYNWRIEQNTLVSKNKWVLLPEISIRRRSNNRGGFIRLDSGLKSSFSDVQSLAENYYLQSYNSIFRGNNSLDNELRHSTSLNYTKSSLLRGTYLLGVLNYTYRINGITQSISTQDQDRLFSRLRLDRPNDSWNAKVIFNKSANHFKYSFRANALRSRSSQNINDHIVDYKGLTGSYRASTQTLYENIPVIEIGMKRSYGIYGFENSNYRFNTTEPYFSIAHDFSGKFVFLGDYTYYRYRNNSLNERNTFSLTNASISYGNENNPWSIKVSAQNIFDVKFKKQNGFDSFIISDQNTFILPRIIMLSILYKL